MNNVTGSKRLSKVDSLPELPRRRSCRRQVAFKDEVSPVFQKARVFETPMAVRNSIAGHEI
jgi:hypothetical protein